MSATLTWREAGPHGSQTAASTIGMLTDLKALIDSNAADPNYLWEVCSSSLVTTPIYLTLRRKDLSDGRILIIGWTSAPAGNNVNILDTSPAIAAVYMCYFPSGNVSTPSNLTAASGTVMGNDTNCVKATCISSNIGITYQAGFRVAYVESAEAFYVFTQSTAGASSVYGGGAGEILVDGNDNVYGGVIGCGAGTWTSLAAFTSNMMPWSSAVINAGATGACVRTNYASANRNMFLAYIPSSNWNAQTFGATADCTVDAAAGKVFFYGMPLLGNNAAKNGPAVKLRQLAWGPGVTAAWQAINASGPVRMALATCHTGPSSVSHMPWFTNFKL